MTKNDHVNQKAKDQDRSDLEAKIREFEEKGGVIEKVGVTIGGKPQPVLVNTNGKRTPATKPKIS